MCFPWKFDRISTAYVFLLWSWGTWCRYLQIHLKRTGHSFAGRFSNLPLYACLTLCAASLRWFLVSDKGGKASGCAVKKYWSKHQSLGSKWRWTSREPSLHELYDVLARVVCSQKCGWNTPESFMPAVPAPEISMILIFVFWMWLTCRRILQRPSFLKVVLLDNFVKFKKGTCRGLGFNTSPETPSMLLCLAFSWLQELTISWQHSSASYRIVPTFLNETKK